MAADTGAEAGAAGSGSAKVLALAAFAVTVALVLALYRDTAMAMVLIWYRSETFNHGFIVLPISLWLIWQRRAVLAVLPLAPEIRVLPLIGLVAAIWLLGDMAGVNAAAQFALVAMLVLVVPATLGLPLAKSIMFPLGFLFFMVPVGEFAMPLLMDWTAEFTVIALRATGIPVFQEGRHFVIPSGRWSVVEACSGVRYLIASTCVGMLFAYLNYVSLRRRMAFIAVSIAVPIIANWLRAYLIVMIGHLSDGKLAAGVDHLIYGWLFFGVVIMIMFMIGARWAERDPLEDPAMPGDGAVTARPAPLKWGTLVAVALVIALPQGALVWLEKNERAAVAPSVRLPEIGGWTPAESRLQWNPAFENPNAAAHRTYERGGRIVGVHVTYYRNQDYSRKLVSSTNDVVMSNDPSWARTASGARVLSGNGLVGKVRTSELRGADDERLLVWHWYWINGHITTSDAMAKLLTAVERLRGRGDDSAAVFLYAARNQSDTDAALEAFVAAAAPAINDALARTKADASGGAR